MEKAELCVISNSMPLQDALQAMQDSGHAAALVRTGLGLRLLTAEQALGALRRSVSPSHVAEGRVKAEAMAEVVTADDVVSLLPPTFLPQRSADADWIRRPEVSQGLAYALGSGERKYAVLREAERHALVITADPLIAASFNLRIALCRCQQHPRTHVWQPHELNKGMCPLDDLPVDCG